MSDVYITTAAAGEIPWIQETEADGITYLVPGTPSAGLIRHYPKSDHLWYSKDSTAVERAFVMDTATQTLTNKTLTTAYVGPSGAPAATELTIVTTSAVDFHGLLSDQYSADTVPSRAYLRKSRGTPGAPATVVSGDELGELYFSGYDSANFLKMAAIKAVSTGTIAATRVPTYLSFNVATNAAPSVLTEVAQMQIGGLQLLGGNYIKPSADSTSALKITKADGTTAIITFDTTNSVIGIGTTAVTPNLINAAVAPSDGTASNIVFNASHSLTSNSDTTASQRIFNFVGTVAGSGGATTGDLVGVNGDVRNNQTAGTWGASAAFAAAVRNQNASTLSQAEGFKTIFIVSGAGSITLGYDLHIRAPSVTSTGAIVTHRGLYIENIGQALTTTSTAIHINTQTGSTNNLYLMLGTTAPTGNWAIHATTTNDSALAGKLMVGSTTAPTAVLHVTGRISGSMDTMTYAATISLDVTLGNLHKTTTVNATGNATINASAAGIAGQHMWILITNDATSGKVITFGTNFLTTGTITGTASKSAVIHFISDGVSWFEVSRTLGL